MAKGRQRKWRTARPPKRVEAPRPARQHEPALEAALEFHAAPTFLTIARCVVAALVTAALAGSFAAYFIPRPQVPGEEVAALERMDALRLRQMLRFCGLSCDEKRRRSPDEWMGGQVFAFTDFWGRYLDERLMPETKCWDWTRDEQIAYLLPGTRRRPIPPPPGDDKRPPIVVGYGLKSNHLEAEPIVPLRSTRPTGTIALDEGRRLGQSFITYYDYDLINAVALVAPRDAALPKEGYAGVIFSQLDRRRTLARTSEALKHEEEGMQVLVLKFGPPLRLKHHRASTPYLFEVTWRRPAGYEGPAPTLALFASTSMPSSEMYVDGDRQPEADLGFIVVGTHTDVSGYSRLWPPLTSDDDAPSEWPPFFFAVRKDVLDRMPPGNPEGETLPELFDRLNKVLLEL